MKKFIYLLAILATSANAQTIKTLGYNTTNGQVSYSGTNALTFTNLLQFSTNSRAATRTNLGLGWSALTNSNTGTALLSVTASTNGVNYNVVNFGTNTNSALIFTNNQAIHMLGFGASLFQQTSYLGVGWKLETNTSEFARARFFADGLYLGSSLATNKVITWGLPSPFWRIDIAPTFAAGVGSTFAGNMGLGTSNNAQFASLTLNGGDLVLSTASIASSDFGFVFSWEERMMTDSGIQIFAYNTNNFDISVPATFGAPAATRTNLGLGLPALTNSSNVTAMRALAGSTNTSEPYSGTVALTNTNVLTFSNGVLLKIQ